MASGIRASRGLADRDREFTAGELVGLRVETLRYISVLLLGPAIILFACLQYLPDPPEGALWLTSISLVLISLITLAYLDVGLTRAALFLIASLGTLCLGQCALFATPLPLYALPLVAFIAGVSLGPWPGFATSIVLSVATLYLPLVGDSAYSSREALVPSLLLVLAAGLAWLGTRQLGTTLAWTWNAYSRMLGLTGELREQHSRLADTIRSLNHAYYLLARTTEELARARVAAEEAHHLKAQFAANISHELRTPLNLIIGFSEMMLLASGRARGVPDGYRADVEAIYRNASHLTSLIDDVLELGQIETGHLGLRKDWIRLAEVADEAIDVVRSLFTDKGLAVTSEVPVDLPPLFVDRTRIRQVFINLLNNAVRFTDVGGVWIRARIVENDVIVSVTDSGVGIDSRDISRVFDEFHQLEQSRLRRAGGTGLGLAISKRFVELHGGSIWVDSVPNGGSTFSFTLPLATSVSGLTLRTTWQTWARPPCPEPDQLPVLIVASADPGPARLFQRHLDSCQIQPVSDLAAAREIRGARGLIRVLADRETLDEAVAETEGLGDRLPVLICRMPSERDLREELDVVDYIVKPFTRERLLAGISRVRRPIRTLLVVDDSTEMVDLVARYLLSAEPAYHVLKAGSGSAALEILQGGEEQVDLVLLDLLMPEPDGLSVLETLRAEPRFRDLPVIVLSARGFVDRTVDSSALVITRRRHLSLRELVACAEAVFDVLDRAGAAPPTGHRAMAEQTLFATNERARVSTPE